MKYLNHYPIQLQQQVQQLIDDEKLGSYLLKKYPQKHNIKTDKVLYSYVMDFKNEYLKKFQISKVLYLF